MSEESIRFSELVEERLGSNENSYDLWKPIAQAFDKDGPDAAEEHLAAEAQQLSERVKNLLARVEGG